MNPVVSLLAEICSQSLVIFSKSGAELAACHPHLVIVAIKVDVSNPDEAKLLFDRAEYEFNAPIHIVVNSIRVLDSKYPTIANTTIEDWETTFNVNTKGAFLICREATNRLKRGGGRRIVLISTSIVGALTPGYNAHGFHKYSGGHHLVIYFKTTINNALYHLM
ncbi:hypothetical protein ACS0TY_018728 [Phlomoides rotata]